MSLRTILFWVGVALLVYWVVEQPAAAATWSTPSATPSIMQSTAQAPPPTARSTAAEVSRGRRHVVPVLPCLAPGALLAFGWTRLGEPLHGDGLGAALILGVLGGILVPGLLVSAEALPQLLVPTRLRMWHRHRRLYRPAIPVYLRRAVYAADGYRCCFCRAVDKLQLDHIRPWSLGGLSALWNLMTLCGNCNRVKSNYWEARDGYTFYSPFAGSGNMAAAAAILACEKRHRWNLLRWMRVGLALVS